MGPFRILFKSDKGHLLVMVGNHGPSPHLTLLSYKGHRGPGNDARESEAPSASHVVVLYRTLWS
jgi:hypothetical protein